MPNTSGIVTTFADTTGLLAAIVNFCAGTKYTQSLGAGNGAQTVFPFTISNTPVAKGNLLIEFTIGAMTYIAFDRGDGSFDHDEIASTTFDYATGTGSVEFAHPLDDTTAFSSIYCVGQNSGEEGRDWLVMLDQTTKKPDGSEAFPGLVLREVILKNSGVSHKEPIYVGLRECQYIPGNFYALQLNVMYNFDKDSIDWNYNKTISGRASYNTSRNAYSTHPHILLNDDSMAYWVISTKQAIMGIARVAGSVYETFYVGQGKRFSAPSKYANPLLAIGSGYGTFNYTETGSSHRYVLTPASYALMAVDNENNYRANDSVILLPMQDFAAIGEITRTEADEIERYPVDLYDDDNDCLLCELDGVFALLDNELQSEDTLTDGAKSFVITQDIFRTTYSSYMAFELQ